VNPVMLPAGLAMLVTNPFSTGSAIWTKTIGMLWVNCCKGATVSEDSPTMTSGFCRTKSAAILRMLAESVPHQRKSM
jgi:hypothetical protein